MKCLKSRNGQALVEFAIIVPILLLVVMGIAQLAMMLNCYITIQNASREGARAGIMGSTDTEIKSIIVSTSPNLDIKNLTVTITPNDTNRKSGSALTVKVGYNYKITIPIIDKLFNNIVLLSGQTSMRIE